MTTPATALIGAVVVAAFAVAALGLRAVDRSGAAVGWVLGTAVWATLGWPGFALLGLFVVTASALTRLGWAEKVARGLAEGRGGRRGARHALANLSVAVLAAMLAALRPEEPWWPLAFAGALAAALADTTGTEVGKAWGRRAFSPTTLRGVPPGTLGAVSLEGTAASAVAALLLGLAGAGLGLYPLGSTPAVALAGFLAAVFESLLSSVRSRRPLLSHDALNLTNTLVGALLAAVLG
ncbi:MAG TPA: DUF92 domain-containing protein [Thermoanaerobaculia bacterium]|nr:DUF92 domain-containing protein [Thermoanaerobaculia bacterium]